MIKIKVSIIPSNDSEPEKSIDLLVPEIPKKGNLFYLKPVKKMSIPYRVEDVCFSQVSAKSCAVSVLLKPAVD